MDGIVSCANYPLCGITKLPSWIANLLRGRCVHCNTIYMCNFVFCDGGDGDACPVCLEDGGLKYVTYQCGHRVCASCFSSVRKTLPGHSPPHPVDFGCIEFEEGDFEDIMDEWAMVFPRQYAAFLVAICEYNQRLVDFNSKKRALMGRCPVCRLECRPITGHDLIV